MYHEEEYKEGVRRVCYEEVYQGKECQKAGILDEVCLGKTVTIGSVLEGCVRRAC